MQTTLINFINSMLPDQDHMTPAAGLGGLVTGVTVRKEGMIMLDCLLEQPCPPQMLCQIENALEKALPAGEVIIRQRFGRHLDSETSSQYAADLRPWLLRHLWKRDAFAASMLSQADFLPGKDHVSICLHEACCPDVDSSGLGILDQLFHEHITANTSFSLQPAAGDLREYTRRLNESHNQRANRERSRTALHPVAAPTATIVPVQPAFAPAAARPRRRQPKPEGVLWGKIRPELAISSIAGLNSESGLVLLEGEVFDLDSREISNGTLLLVKFSLTDFDDSISCVLFAKPEEKDSLEGQLKDAWIRLNAEISFDSKFAKDLQARVVGLQTATRQPPRRDHAAVKRIELHAHTKLSTKDSLCDPGDLVRLAAEFGQGAIAVTDHGVVQSFPEIAAAAAELAKNDKPVKVIFGLEGYLVDDGRAVAWQTENASLEEGFVAIDVETTGLDPSLDRVIEVAAVWFKPDAGGGYSPADSLISLVNPGIPVPTRSQELTGISTEMLADAPEPFAVIEQLVRFIANRPVVAHNALFDLGFLRSEGFRTRRQNDPRLKFNPPLVDTLALARAMLPGLANHKLNTVTEHLDIRIDRHHRAASDAEACGKVFASLMARSGATDLEELNHRLGRQSIEEIREHKRNVNHIILLARDEVGLYNLYRLVSESHIRYFHTRPRIPKSVLQYFRTGLIVGGACESGEIFQAVLELYRSCDNNPEKATGNLRKPELVNLARFYDYLEIQPITNNKFYLNDQKSGLTRVEDLQNINRLIVSLGRQLKKLVCATGDVHFLQPRDADIRRILMTDMGFADANNQAELYFRTTDEMLTEFAYLGEEQARAVVIEDPATIAGQVQSGLKPFPEGSFPPVIASAAEEVRQLTWDTAQAIYGQNGVLPDIVRQRVERELSSIIENGFAVMYYIACKLVKKSNDDGYIVGSRGSVGSSLVATLCGISEVNPLPPHYVCPGCHFSEFDASGAYGSGYDLPDRACPQCRTPLSREGQDIPFETFLGFNGDKQPDIDLNFSGEYQARAHKFIEEMFGPSHTFRAGTIGGYAEKNALAIVGNYFKDRQQFVTQAQINRLSRGLIGVKRTTGQHPGGIVVVPRDREIYDFTPIQHPADKIAAGTITTHFDFNAMHDTILKLDILGHDDPTMLKMLGDLTGVDVRTIPIPDQKVMSLFQTTGALGIVEGTAPSGTATLGLPEMGTFMAREMIRETRPSRFFDLVQLMGLSHGTDVWKGNAQDLIRSGTCTIDEVIGCRDSIMTWLIYKGLPPKAAFDIMEKVRKGKGVSPEHEQMMRDNHVPEWYIESCKKIRYMFPKAHAAAYTISSLRIAWFKVYWPEEYYCAYFTVRADEFDSCRMCLAPGKIRESREKLKTGFRDLSDREQKIYYILELVEEMQLRGIDFKPISLDLSAATAFSKIAPGQIRPPLNAIPSISAAMAENIVKARADGPFNSRDDLMRRAGIGQSAIDTLAEAGCLNDLPDTSQIDMFELLG